MFNTGPIKLVVVGDAYALPVRISKILWIGATTAADTVTIGDPTNNSVLYTARTAVINTHLSENWFHGLHAPNGFKLTQVSAGVVYVYVEED